MIRTETSEDELDRLMARVRAEIAEQDRRSAADAPSPVAATVGEPLSAAAEKRSVRLRNLLRREDGAFVEACFRTVLGRAPDPGEAAYHAERLRDGRLRKLGLIEELRFSKAGRKRGVTIKGLRARRLVSRLGRLPGVATVATLVRLPRLASNVQRIRRQTERLNEAIGGLPGALADRVPRADSQVEALRHDIGDMRRDLLAALDAGMAELRRGPDPALVARLPALVDERLQTAQVRLERLLDERLQRQRDELAGRLGQLERDVKALGAAVEGSHGRLGELNERLVVVQRAVRGRAPAGPEGELGPVVGPVADEAGDALYAAFEDRFRGSRQDIRRRQEAHLPLLEKQGSGLARLPVLDLGCGRGEWLELLRDRSIAAVGVDRNRVFLADNAGRGLDVIEGDALGHLRGLPEGSLRAVTGFHIIEHLPFATLVAILDEGLRVLAEGGLILLETPNPENLVTAAHRFYFDPTHRHPIPPELAAFLLRARGYRDVTLRRLHADTGPAREAVAEGVLRDLLFGPQDFAVVGYR